jgi:hypothetical protein
MRGAGRETRGKVRHSTPCCVHEDHPTARLFGARLSEKLGQQVVIDNRPGAGATIGHGLPPRPRPTSFTS